MTDLCLKSASVVRGGRAILDAATLRCQLGHFSVLCGANGAGKSTALSVLSGALKPDRGGAFIDDEAMSHVSPAALARTRAIVAQQSVLTFPFLVHEVVAMGRTPHEGRSDKRRDDEIIIAALDRLDLLGLATRNYLTLSGGERQRVHIARALAQLWSDEGQPGPRWLLLDEPTSALDLKYQIALMKLLKALAKDGWGIVAVLHDLHLVRDYADHVVMFKAGAVIDAGTPIDVLNAQAIQIAYDLDGPYDLQVRSAAAAP